MPHNVPPKIIKIDTIKTSKNSCPLVFLVNANNPDSKAPLVCTTPIKPPSTRINTMTSTASIVPFTILVVI